MEDPEDYVQVIEHERVIIGMRTDGIIHVRFLSNTEITIELQNILISIYNEITQGENANFIFEGGEFVSISKEAREHATVLESISPVYASAVLIKNLGQKIIADFYYKINKPSRPFKVFSNFEEAIVWLKSHENINKWVKYFVHDKSQFLDDLMCLVLHKIQKHGLE